jgi:hypothetical protein
MRGSNLSTAVNAAAYGLITWHFLTAAALLLISSVIFAARVQAEVLVSAPGGLFLAYVGMQFANRFARSIHGDSFLL